jgi:multiple sugar transport system permease protein
MKTFSKLAVILLCALAAGPFFWHIVSSVKDPAEVTQIPPTLLPVRPTIENYVYLFAQRPFLTYGMNSFIIASLSSVLCVASASLAAYRLARSGAQVRSLVSSALLGLAFFPPIVFLFPLYELVRTLGLINHPWGLIAPYAAINLPLSIWLLTGYFRQIPAELEEAAELDGLTPLQTFLTIVLPLGAPALATSMALVFVFSWNEYMLALTFMNAEEARTVTVAVATISGAFVYQIPWGVIAAGVVASSVPLIVLAVLFQKRIVAGLTAGSLKFSRQQRAGVGNLFQSFY